VTAAPAEVTPANEEIWSAFVRFAEALAANVKYGPGRGIWDAELERFLITYAPGRKSKPSDVIAWENVLGKLYASLHCTSLCNVVLAWLLRRNGDYTHAGNIPELFELLTAGPEPHVQAGVGTWRGYGDACFEIHVERLDREGGCTRSSTARRTSTPSSSTSAARRCRRSWCSASRPRPWTAGTSGTTPGLFAFREGRMYRLAADGYHGAKGYSATPVRWTEITPANISALDLCRYRVFGVTTLDGSFGDHSRPIAELAFE
jgi:hypothetical protein